MIASATSPVPAAGEIAARVDRLRLQLRDASVAFIARVRECEPAADALADLEAQLQAAECAAGVHEFRPPLRQLAAEATTGLLRALQPHLRPIASRDAAERAIEELLSR